MVYSYEYAWPFAKFKPLVSPLSGFALSNVATLKTVKVKVKVTLRLAVYRQSVRLGVKPLDTHDQTFSFSTELLC
jgi:hypothetical protein